MGYELEWNKIYGMDKDPIRKYLLFPLIYSRYKELLDNKIILDAGCGNGNLMNFLLEFKFKNAVGIDISDEFLNTAKKTIIDSRIQFVKSDLLLEMPFENESFNLIFSVFVLNELPHIENHLRDLSRVLTKDGEIMIIMTHPFFVLYYYFQERFTGIKNNKINDVKGYFDKSLLMYNFTLANTKSNYFQYTFEDILNPLIKCGLIVNEIIELRTDNKEFKAIPQYWDTRDIPKFLFLRLKKCN